MTKTILIIEDDNFLQGLEAKKLKKEGYEIATAANSVEAFAIINGTIKIDLILLDLLLPDVDGFEILEKIRENPVYKTVPVIIFSNLSEEKDIDEELDPLCASIKGHILKLLRIKKGFSKLGNCI